MLNSNMTLAMRIHDDLEGGEIELKNAVNWYGYIKELLKVVCHLQQDQKILVYHFPGRTLVEDWELKEIIRNMEIEKDGISSMEGIWMELLLD